MDTRYSPEQLELRRSTAALVDDLGPRTVDDLDDAVRRDRLADAALRSGWFELRGPGEDDGPLASGVEVAIIARELGRVAADTPFFGPVVAADLARRAGLELEDAHAGIVLDGALLDLAVVPSSRSTDGVAVDCAGAARGLVLSTTDDVRVGEVELGVPAPATDLTRALAPVDLASSSVSALDGGALGDDALQRCRALALAITVADLVGTMEGALHTTCEYAKERHQYGVAIGSFQAVQHLLAEARGAAGGLDQRVAARRVGGGRAAAGRRPARPVRWPRRTARGQPAPCARPRSRCTVGSATPGSASRTCYLRRALLSSALLGDEGEQLRQALAHDVDSG